MHTQRIQIVAAVVVGVALLVVVAALMKPAKPVVVSGRPETPTQTEHRQSDTAAPSDETRRPLSPRTDDASAAERSADSAAVPASATESLAGDTPSAATLSGDRPPVQPGHLATTETLQGQAVPSMPGEFDWAGGVGVAMSPDGRPRTHGDGGLPDGGTQTGAARLDRDAGTDASGSRSSTASTGSETDSVGVGEGEEDVLPEPGEALVGGVVIRGDQPIPSAKLLLSGTGRTLQAATDSAGTYRFAPITAGYYVLTLLEPESPSSSRNLVVEPDDRLLAQDFIIPAGAAARGQVLDIGRNTGIQNAKIIVKTAAERYVTESRSTLDGWFETPPLEPGDYFFRAEAAGYQTRQDSVTVPDSSGTGFIQVRIQMEPANVIEGRVLGPTGAPVPGTRVGLFSLGGVSTWTDPLAQVSYVVADSAGRYRLANLPPVTGGFQVGAWAEGVLGTYGPALELPEAAQGEVPTVNLDPGVQVTGLLVDSNGHPVDGVRVAIPTRASFPRTGRILERFNATPPEMLTGSDGTFHLSGVEEGSMTLDISSPGYIPVRHGFQSTPPSVNLGRITLESEGDEGKSGTIFGQIVDENIEPLRRPNCVLTHRNVSPVRTTYQEANDQGMFTFTDLDEGLYSLKIDGSLMREVHIWIRVGQEIAGLSPGSPSLLAVFDLTGAVRLRVRDAMGNPIRRFKVEVYSDGRWPNAPRGEPFHAYSNYETTFESSEGEALVRYLIPGGTARFKVTAESYGVEQIADVPVPLSGPGDAGTLTIGKGGRLEGYLHDSFNQPVEGLRADILPANAHPNTSALASATTNSSGRFVIQPLMADSYTLRLSGGNWLQRTVAGITIVEGETTDAGYIQMERGGIVIGTVYRPGGTEPAPGVSVKCGTATTHSDTGGEFRLEGVPLGAQKLEANNWIGSPEYAILDIHVVPGETVRRDILLLLR